MSVNEIQILAQRFADAFVKRDMKTVLEMLSDDVEVFDHVPYRFDGKQLFAKYLNEAVEGIASMSFGFRQPSGRQGADHPRANHPRLHQTKRAVEDCKRPLLGHAADSLRSRRRYPLPERLP